MKKIGFSLLLLPLWLAAQSAPGSSPASAPAAKPAPASAPAAAAGDAKAEVQIGTGVENHAIQGAAEKFSVAAGSKLWAWAQLEGMTPGATLKIVWKKDGKEVSTSTLSTPVPAARYRTQGFRTFRAGDAGNWTAEFMTSDGASLGSASFTVEING